MGADFPPVLNASPTHMAINADEVDRLFDLADELQYSIRKYKYRSFFEIIITIASFVFPFLKLRREKTSDERALASVLTLLHELEPEIARQQDWGPLRRAEFRIRLSRYDFP
jgi:hypothetical protein